MIIYDHMGHMVSTTNAGELHTFAGLIGLKLSWYQYYGNTDYHAHYDLTTYRMMNKARRQGATMVDPKELIKKAWWSNERTTTKDR